MQQGKKRLGRGLDSLFGILDDADEKVLSAKPEEKEKVVEEVKKQVAKEVVGGVVEIDISLIDQNVDQPRKHFDPSALKELSESISMHGIIQPIILNKNKDRYLIVAGERRFRAAKMAGLKAVPAVVKEYSEQQVKEIALLENIQREDLNAIEAARAMKELLDAYNWTQEELATRLGKSRPAVSNLLRLLTLQPEVVAMIESGKLSPGHARSLVVVTDPKAQIRLAELATTKKVTVRDLEDAVREVHAPKKRSLQQRSQVSVEFKDLIERMKRTFGTKVSYKGNDNKGKLIIDYYSKDDLDRILEILRKS